MADLRVKTGTSAVVYGDNDTTPVDVRATRDGAMFTVPWLTGLALEGRCFGINVGADTTPLAFTAGFTATKPEAYITVPTGTTIIPVLIEVAMEDTSSISVIDCVATLSAVIDTSPGGNSLTIHNMRTDKPRKSLCTATSIVTTGTAPYTGNFLEFWRGTAGVVPDGYNSATAQTSELNSKTSWCVSDALAPPVIVGPGSLSVWCSLADGTTGWIIVIWAEVPSNSIV